MARRRSKARKPPVSAALRVGVEVVSVEMVRGHDGLLRGHPEPTLVVGLYLVGAGTARLVGRGQLTLFPRGTYPLVVTPAEGAELVRAQAVAGKDEVFALLAIALERDGGSDLAAIYGALPDAAGIRLWEATSPVPSPLPIGEMVQLAGAAPVRVVQAIVGDLDLGRACRDDELVGACLAAAGRQRRTEDLRLPFATADGRNDWTAVLRVALR